MVLGCIVFISLLLTIVWLKQPLPWIFLTSIVAANPVNLLSPISLNLTFAIWLVLLRFDLVWDVPRWVFVPLLLSLASAACSSLNWLFGSSNLEPLNQIPLVLNYLLAPFFLLPIIYSRVAMTKNTHSLLGGLLFFLILPSTIFVLAAYIFGHPIESNYKNLDSQINLYVYELGKTVFHFIRTQIGFLLASMICASTSVAICRVRPLYRFLAAGSLAINFFLLLVTGSVASTIACICGLVVILIVGRGHFSAVKYATSLALVVGLLFSVWAFSPKFIRQYESQRYEERSRGGIDASDRTVIWARAFDYMLQNPVGVGWSLLVNDTIGYPHNDYLSYAIAYGILCGFAYLYVLFRLLLSLMKSVKSIGDHSELAIKLSGVGAVVVILVNSISDHLTANRWYFAVLWSIAWYAYFSKSVDPNSLIPSSLKSIGGSIAWMSRDNK